MLSIRAHSMEMRPRRGYFWMVMAAVFATSIWGTVRMCGSMSGSDMQMPGGWTMSMAWMRMPGQTWPQAIAAFLSMWTVMMVAMMLPCLAPMLADYRRQTAGPGVNVKGSLMGLGYFSTWALIGAIAYAIGVPIAYAQMWHDSLSTPAPIATAVIVVIAGAAQFTSAKSRLLSHCRRDDTCRPVLSTFGAFRYGLRLGVDCGKCCAGYMMILLVTNVMSLPIMAALTVAIAAERLSPHPALVARLTGAVTVVVGVVMLARVI